MSAQVGMVSLCLMVAWAGSVVQAQPAAQDSAPSFIISGTSTVRSWSCPARGVIKVTPGRTAPPVPGFPNGVQSLVITVPVNNIACEESEMVVHLREALKATAYPDILYQLDQYTLTGNETAKTTGRLTITGLTRPVSFDVKLIQSPHGVRTVGETSVDMTQFKVTPPDLWNGLLRVGKDVRIRFDAVLPPSVMLP